jgi:hypothetical protein
VLILANLYILNYYVLYPNNPQPYQADWNKLAELTGESKRILNSPAISPMLIEKGKQIVDSGESEYFYAIRPYPPTALAPSYEKIVRRGQDYLNEVNDIVRNKGYDQVIITEDYSPFISEAILRIYYTHTETISIVMPQTHQSWKLQVWVPKK